MPKRSRWLVLALVVAFGTAGAAAVAVWRARGPSRTLRVSFGTEPVPYSGRARIIHGPPMRFVGSSHLLIAEEFLEHGIEYRGQVWSIETTQLERTLPSFPDAVGPGSTQALVVEAWNQPAMLTDLLTGAARPLPGVHSASALSSNGELTATQTRSGSIELRSTRDGAVVRTLTVAEPPGPSHTQASPFFSRNTDRLGVYWDRSISACDLLTESWSDAGPGYPIGFTPSGLVMVPFDEKFRNEAPVLVGPDGKHHEIKGATADARRALSASGEWFATLTTSEQGTSEIVVQRVETGEVVRRIPIARGRSLHCLALSPEGERLAIAIEQPSESVATFVRSSDCIVEIWELP